jgi:hypothetical protein
MRTQAAANLPFVTLSVIFMARMSDVLHAVAEKIGLPVEVVN